MPEHSPTQPASGYWPSVPGNMKRWLDGWTDGRGRRDGWLDGWMDVQTDGYAEGWMDGGDGII